MAACTAGIALRFVACKSRIAQLSGRRKAQGALGGPRRDARMRPDAMRKRARTPRASD